MMQVYPYPKVSNNITTTSSETKIEGTVENWENRTLGCDERYAKSACLWDNISEEDKMKPMGLSCGCPKCSAWC